MAREEFKWKQSAFRITLIYLIVGMLWIVLSDQILAFFTGDSTILTPLQSLKGWCYVIATSVMLYFLIHRNLVAIRRADKELRTSEARYRELVQNANSIIIRMNPGGNITFFNEFAQSFFGYSEAEILGRNVMGTIVPEIDTSGKDLSAMIQDVLGNPERYEANENENMRRSGERVWVAWANKAVRDEKGNLREILCIGNDMTARRRTEETLHRTMRALDVLRQCNQALVHARGESHILNDICRIMVERGGYPIAWIWLSGGKDDEKAFPLWAQAGIEDARFEAMSSSVIGAEKWCDPATTLMVANDPYIVLRDISDDRSCSPFQNEAVKRGCTSSISLPLRINGERLGALNAYAADPRAFDAEETNLLVQLALDIAYSIRSLRAGRQQKLAEDALKERLAELVAINELGRRVAADLSLNQVISSAQECILSILAPDTTLLYLVSGDQLIFKNAKPGLLEFGQMGNRVQRIGQCLCGLAAQERSPVYSLDIHSDTRCTLDECKQTGIGSFAALPLMAGGNVLGVLGLGSVRERDFSRQSDFLEALTNQIAAALQNATLYQQVSENAKQLEKHMNERKQLESQLQQAQKMEAIGTLAGGIAHDFNNILSPIIGYTEMALTRVPADDPLHKYLQHVSKAANRAKDLVKQILTFSYKSEQMSRPVRISLIIKEALKLLRASLPSTIEIRRNISPDAEPKTVMADPTHIHQVVMNLCTNAAHAMRDRGGIMEIRLTSVDLDSDFTAKHPDITPGSYLKLTVRDTGQGMEQAVKERIFDPYFTTKKQSEGTGLGLSVVYGIINGYNGLISVESEPGKGTAFDVFLPTVEIAHECEADTMADIPLGEERILLVDDEEVIAEMERQMLEKLGYEVTLKTNSMDAMQAFRTAPDRFDIIITDQTMPHMTGTELAKEMLRIRPDVPIILCTGFSEMITDERARETGIRELILKPFSLHNLAVIIRKLLDEK